VFTSVILPFEHSHRAQTARPLPAQGHAGQRAQSERGSAGPAADLALARVGLLCVSKGKWVVVERLNCVHVCPHKVIMSRHCQFACYILILVVSFDAVRTADILGRARHRRRLYAART